MIIATTAFEALRMGASVFRGFVDLPARDRLGAIAFAKFSRATDLSTRGFVFYVIYGVGGALLTCATCLVTVRTRAPLFVRWLSAISATSSLLVLMFTLKAAPLMLRIGSSPDDEGTLSQLLDGFALWTSPRFLCAFVSFAAMFTAMARLAGASVEAKNGSHAPRAASS